MHLIDVGLKTSNAGVADERSLALRMAHFLFHPGDRQAVIQLRVILGLRRLRVLHSCSQAWCSSSYSIMMSAAWSTRSCEVQQAPTIDDAVACEQA
jgi:hypothetical protein